MTGYGSARVVNPGSPGSVGGAGGRGPSAGQNQPNTGSPSSSYNQVQQQSQVRVIEPETQTLQGRVRAATEQAVRDALNAGLGKRGALAARDAAKARVLGDAIRRGSGSPNEWAEVRAELDAGNPHTSLAVDAQRYGFVDAAGGPSWRMSGPAQGIDANGLPLKPSVGSLGIQMTPINPPSRNVTAPEIKGAVGYEFNNMLTNPNRFAAAKEMNDQMQNVTTTEGGKIRRENNPELTRSQRMGRYAVDYGKQYETQYSEMRGEMLKSGFEKQLEKYGESSVVGKNAKRALSDIEKNGVPRGESIDYVPFAGGLVFAGAEQFGVDFDEFGGAPSTKFRPENGELNFETPRWAQSLYEMSENVQAKGNELFKNAGIGGQFVRGATFDNVAGGLAAAGWGWDTPNKVFRLDRTGLKLKQEGAVEAFDIFGYQVGGLLGGTAVAAIDEPAAFSGSLIVPVVSKATGNIAWQKAQGKLRTATLEPRPYKSFAKENVWREEGDIFRVGKGREYPYGYPVEDGLIGADSMVRMFDDTKNLYPNPSSIPAGKTVGIHAHPNDWGRQHFGRIGKHGDPGTFLGPNASYRFLRGPALVIDDITFNPLAPVAAAAGTVKKFRDNIRYRGFEKAVKETVAYKMLTGQQDLVRPSLDFVIVDKIERLPEDLRHDKKAARKFTVTKTDADKAYTTYKMERNAANGYPFTEVEAVVPPGAEVRRIERKYKTRANFPIKLFGMEKIPGTNIKLQYGVDVPISLYETTGRFKEVDRKRATAIVNTDRGVLLVEEKNSGKLNLPGGGVETWTENLMPEKAVRRELFEETGIRADNAKRLFEWTDPEQKRSNEGGLYRNQHLVYEIDYNGAPQSLELQKKEIRGIEYWDPETAIPDNVNPATREILRQWKDAHREMFDRGDVGLERAYSELDSITAELDRTYAEAMSWADERVFGESNAFQKANDSPNRSMFYDELSGAVKKRSEKANKPRNLKINATYGYGQGVKRTLSKNKYGNHQSGRSFVENYYKNQPKEGAELAVWADAAKYGKMPSDEKPIWENYGRQAPPKIETGHAEYGMVPHPKRRAQIFKMIEEPEPELFEPNRKVTKGRRKRRREDREINPIADILGLLR